MAEREIEATVEGSLPFLHQLARHVVDGGDMVGIDRMPETEAIGEQRGAQEHRMVGERDKRPDPGRDVDADEPGIDRNELRA